MIPRWCFLLFGGAAVAIAVAGCAVRTPVAAEPKSHPEVAYERPFPIVAFSEHANAPVADAAKQIADLIGTKMIWKGKGNPVCCVWLEVTNWKPNPGEDGYVIINQGGGSIISASSEEQLLKAVERFKAASRKGAEGVTVPMGIMTSYPIVPPEAEAR